MKIRDQLLTVLIVLVLSLMSGLCLAQSYQAKSVQNKSEFQWPDGKKMGLSLTFDDARLTQVDKGIPLLNKYGVKATFYLLPDKMVLRLEAWKKAVACGHEIGDHSLLHPCTGNFAWSRGNALEDYTLLGMSLELDSSSNIIQKSLGIRPVSFAYPCGQKFVGRGKMTKSYVPVISAKFESGRGWLDEGPNDPSFCDLSQLTGMELDAKSFEQIKAIIDTAKIKGQWLVLAGHEIDAGGFQTSRLTTIEAICKYAIDPANGIWIDNVHNIAAYIKEKRGEQPFRERSGQNTLNKESFIRMGASQINITPDKPTLMAGYDSRKTPYISVHDSLYASALYFSNEKTKALLITADLEGFSNQFVDELKKNIASKIGIPFKNIMIIAVHNHGGPEISAYNGYDYPEVLKEKLARITLVASKQTVPIRMGIGKGSCNLNINRRAEFADSTIWLGKNPDGPCDHELDVVKFEDLNHNTIAVLINWPCHATTSGEGNFLITADWPGGAARYIKKQEGKGPVVAITAGASADINPIYGPENEFYDIEAVGFHVGMEAWKTLAQIETYPVKTLESAYTSMTFSGKKIDKNHMAQTSYEGAPDGEIKLTALKIGGLVLTGISGELMTEIGMKIKKQSPYSNTVIVTHCNGSSGYICTDKSFSEGGYEVMVSGFMPGVEIPLTSKFLELIHSFKE